VIGHTEKFSIVAVRSCGTASCSGGHLDSPSPATASATFRKPPATPTPTPTPTDSGSATPTPGGGSSGSPGSGSGSTPGNSGGGSGKGGGAGAGSVGSSSGGSGALTFGGTGPVGGKHNNGGGISAFSGDPLPALGLPTLPGAETSTRPLKLGKPGGKIAYPAPIVADKQRSTVRTIGHDITSSFSGRSLWQGIGAAAVLLLLAFHLRTWAGRETY
jgi:hypothetical protein